MHFDFDQVMTTEFVVGFEDEEGNDRFCNVAVDIDVQDALTEMILTTYSTMRASTEPTQYDPSEKYASIEYLIIPLHHDLASRLRSFHESVNLPMNNRALDSPERVFCYMTRMRDRHGRRLTGVRRASHFKGTVGKRLVRFVTDAMRLIEGQVFRLDNDFDVLIDSENVHILRPASFEYLGQLTEAVLASVTRNVNILQTALPYVDFSTIERYASTHPRAARHLASIRSQRATQEIDRESLVNMCRKTQVQVFEEGEQLRVADGHVMGFLEVLDRRRYEIELVLNSPEQYRATSRQRIMRAGA